MKLLNTKIINIVLKKDILKEIEFSNLDFVDSKIYNTLTFCETIGYFHRAIENPNIKGIICNEEIISSIPCDKFLISSENPGFDFTLLHNFLCSHNQNIEPSLIHSNTKIDPTASISATGVIIEEGVEIGPFTTVHSNVIIKNNTIIGANSVIGCDDIEIKLGKEGFINASHDGNLQIGSNCIIGSNVTIVKGIYKKTTAIGDRTFVSNNSFIGHNVEIGERSLILSCHVCGSVKIGVNVRINPKALISNGIVLGNNVTVTLGSVVISNVKDGMTVSGYYAIDHYKYLYKFVKLFGKP
jgi:UDP-3-O-[3-hydroxymyristoyl] glucosamine N-acyltransferase